LTKQTLKALAICHRYDLVLANNIAAILPLALVHSFLHKSKPILVGVDISASRAGPNLTRIFKVAVKSMDAIICYTSAQRSWWANNVGFTKSIFIPYGWGFADVRYAPESVINALLDAAKTDDTDYVFSGGYIARDYKTLLRAASDLSLRVVLVVGFDPITGKNGLEDVVLSEKVKVYSDIPPSHFRELMSKARIVVLAMQDKPYCAGTMVLLNAMAMGKPIIVTRTAGTIDYVEDGKTALLVEPGNVSQLKEKISLILKDVDLQRTLGKNARAKWQREFTVSTMRGKIYDLLAGVSEQT
jgi:glycosyltransferase involved in cell wall biosynthesis